MHGLGKARYVPLVVCLVTVAGVGGSAGGLLLGKGVVAVGCHEHGGGEAGVSFGKPLHPAEHCVYFNVGV